MPVQAQFQQYSHDRLFSVERQARIEYVCLDNLDFSNGEKIEYARKQITEMGIWDSFLDMICNHHAKEAFLENLADKILLDKADIWRKGNPGKHCEYPRSDALRKRAFLNMLRLLSPLGRQAMLARSELEGEAIRLTPDTGMAHVDKLLSMKLLPLEAASCFVDAGMPGAASLAIDVAVRLMLKMGNPGTVNLQEAVRLSSMQARYAETSLSSEAVLPLDAAKKAWKRTAKLYRRRVLQCNTNHSEAAAACREEALAWQAAGMYEDEAKAWCDRGRRLKTLSEHAKVLRDCYKLKKESDEAYAAMRIADENLQIEKARSKSLNRWAAARFHDLTSLA